MLAPKVTPEFVQAPEVLSILSPKVTTADIVEMIKSEQVKKECK
jgi:hypothetical protein